LCGEEEIIQKKTLIQGQDEEEEEPVQMKESPGTDDKK